MAVTSIPTLSKRMDHFFFFFFFFRGGGKNESIRKSQKELEKTKKKHTHLNPENNFCNLTLNMNIPCY